MTWHNGVQEDITVDNELNFLNLTDYSGKQQRAELISTGVLKWKGGEIWTLNIQGTLLLILTLLG